MTVSVVNVDMSNDVLVQAMNAFTQEQVNAMLITMQYWYEKRNEFEKGVERKSPSKGIYSERPKDMDFLKKVSESESVARLFLALDTNVEAYFFPHNSDRKDRNADSETSNMKAYHKLLGIAETIHTGHAKNLEKVLRAWFVCASIAQKHGQDVMTREFCEGFIRSDNYRKMTHASEALLEAIAHIRDNSITGGSPTQTSQIVRTLVALGAAKDVRDGNKKNTVLLSDSLVSQALLKRLGQIETVSELAQNQEIASEATEEVKEVKRKNRKVA